MRVNPAGWTDEMRTVATNAQISPAEGSNSMKAEQRRQFLAAVSTFGFLCTDIGPISYVLEWIDSIPWIVA